MPTLVALKRKSQRWDDKEEGVTNQTYLPKRTSFSLGLLEERLEHEPIVHVNGRRTRRAKCASQLLAI